ncbi:MAG: PTS fructose transporter subunit IIA [bacterium]
MIGIVIVTHGELGAKLVETGQWIGLKKENLEIVSFFPSEGLDDLSNKISNAIKKVDKGDGVVLLTDLLHGSCSKVAGEFLEQKGIEVICGVNLPMIISLMSHQDLDLHQAVKKAKESSRKDIVSLRELLKGKKE